MVESRSPANPLFLRDEELRQGIELMFYAYRDFTFESDQQLKRYQLGRAHHRALYFIGRHPGQTVGHLLSILKVTKQSISRVLKDLLEQDYVEQKSGPRDRRERRLWLTEKGVKLERELTDRQSQRFARAYRETGADAVEGFRKVLLGLLDPAERVESSTSGCAGAAAEHGRPGRQAARPGRRRRHAPARAPEVVPVAQRLSRQHRRATPPRRASARARSTST